MFCEKHTFAICAYKESDYLEECILSLIHQTVQSKIIMITSTPNNYIKDLAAKYDIQYLVNEGEGGIVQDWNFAYQNADTRYVTIAHQDDIYFEEYVERMIEYAEKNKDMLIYFTDYVELRNGKIIKKNRLLGIKRFMLTPLQYKCFYRSRFIRRRILSLGSPICCPSVTFDKKNLPKPVFQVGFRSNEDWEAWEKISKLRGAFLYCKKALVAHRIHKDSETSAIIADNKRSEEDAIMYLKFWPPIVAKILVKLYAKGQESNKL